MKYTLEPSVKERPILFSAEMVRAILDNLKSQTRRIVKATMAEVVGRNADGELDNDVPRPMPDWQRTALLDNCHYGHPGDRLWVRETWMVHECYDQLAPRDIDPIDHDAPQEPVAQRVWYPADSYRANRSMSNGDTGFAGKTRVSIHMPRWASRISLEITDVRVERVQDIREDDAIAEGVDAISVEAVPRQAVWTRRQDFAQLWDRVNGKGAWKRNDWVWAITFRRLEDRP